MTHLLFLGHR